ncbi:MFS transporter [Gordonibacter sp.]|uniref:MFS transporter n=1 Tax=Gordonibacter sp. TaxID=1968902 RepID=UPI001F865969|nr:MFS transporter [Gordonibacter sp.]HIW77353.1 MFS transporter [Candidatus Gordonibacter avicola]
MSLTSPARTPRSGLVVSLLVAHAFALGFAEFVLIGITPDVAGALGEPLTRIGDLVGYYALACAVATPLVSLATARIDRLKLTAALLVVFNAGNLLTLFANDYALLVVSRLMPAITSGTLLAVALTYVPDIVGKEKAPRVLGLLLAGFSVSSVVGVPIGTLLADAFGWKAAYGCVFALGLVVSIALLPALPRRTDAPTSPSVNPTTSTPTVRSQLRILTDSRVLVNTAMILLGAAATYVFHTYLTPVLEGPLGLDGAAASAMLLLVGAACVGSNLLSGWIAERFGLHALPLTFGLHAIALALLAVTIPTGLPALANILVVAVLMYAMNSTVQMLYQTVARTDYPAAVTFSASLHPMSFNAGIALGSFAGGIVVNTEGLLATGPVGALFALAAGGLALVLVRLVATRHAEERSGERAVKQDAA